MTNGVMIELGSLQRMQNVDLERVLNWRNAPGVRQNMYTRHEITPEEHAAWWANTANRGDRAYFIYNHDNAPLGVVGFTQIDLKNGTAAWAFYAAPEAPRGTGSRMEFLALEHAFSVLKLNKLWCEVLAFNKPVIDLHTKFGFSEEGVFRHHIRLDGGYTDIHRLATFAKDWKKRRDLMLAKLTDKESQ